MPNKRVGIITLYHESTNYGGNLQAYALCKFLRNNDVTAEQISFKGGATANTAKGGRLLATIKRNGVKNILKKAFKRLQLLLLAPIHKLYVNPKKRAEDQKHNVIVRRKEAFAKFNHELIPHSENVYTAKNIGDTMNDYDVFITGSDQVWNLRWYNPIFFLNFVSSEKVKLSYAASMAMGDLTNAQKKLFKEHLKDYQAISVREKGAVKALSECASVPIEHVLDPTLLLTQEDWDKVREERPIEGEYLFCYFLGVNKKNRVLAEQFAKHNHLKLVTIAHAVGGGVIRLQDREFGDEKLFDVSPQQFLSLIKNASFVFTDSFHAVVFSRIYQKEYVVFNRDKKGSMNSRIRDITELFGTTERFCGSKEREDLEYISKLEKIDYTKTNAKFDELQKFSREFLLSNVKD